MNQPAAQLAENNLRPASKVMRLEQMGSFFPTRLSFLRTLMRELRDHKAKVTRPVWQIDDEGFGRAVYTVSFDEQGQTRNYSLCAFSTPISEEQRTDRVIAEVWDTTYVLFDGIPDTADLDRLENNAPKQEAGRFLPSELVLCRANKSVRLFGHVVERLANGEQPDDKQICSIGYLMRTTAVYGNGKFGIADRSVIADRLLLSNSFAAEMLAVWLVRGFTHDLVEHVAKAKNPEKFVPLARKVKHHLGIGNSTGLGMAPFLVNHPLLLNNWMMARETAIGRVAALEACSDEKRQKLLALWSRVKAHLGEWQTEDTRQGERVLRLRKQVNSIPIEQIENALNEPHPFKSFMGLSNGGFAEFEELLVALALEVNGEIIDDLGRQMIADTQPPINASMTIGRVKEILSENFGWALDLDYEDKQNCARFWYVSEEKLEPRLGERFEEDGADLETPLDIARRASQLAKAINGIEDTTKVASFLADQPKYRDIVWRIQLNEKAPYSEIHDNLISADCMPIDMLRCKLSFFGASKFDPKSDRWTRINLCQGAPLFDELGEADMDDWFLPIF